MVLCCSCARLNGRPRHVNLNDSGRSTCPSSWRLSSSRACASVELSSMVIDPTGTAFPGPPPSGVPLSCAAQTRRHCPWLQNLDYDSGPMRGTEIACRLHAEPRFRGRVMIRSGNKDLHTYSSVPGVDLVLSKDDPVRGASNLEEHEPRARGVRRRITEPKQYQYGFCETISVSSGSYSKLLGFTTSLVSLSSFIHCP